MLDFLKEIVETVPDPSAGGTIDLESENVDGKKKRGKGKRVGAGAAAGEPSTKRRRKKKGDVETEVEGTGEGDAEMKSEHDGDAAMHEDSAIQRERNGSPGYRPRSPSENGDWQEDKPFMPRR